jgi:cytidylate kinase
MIIAMDGPAGVGKSTVAKKVAQKLGIPYINSGNFYRAITYAHLAHEKDPTCNSSVINTARNIALTLHGGRLHLEGMDIEHHLHSDQVDAFVAQHSANVEVRHVVNRLIRSLTKNIDALIEGRDIGTVVYPDAAFKVYLDASAEIRAERRYRQGTSEKSLEELEKNILMRDEIDMHKEEGSLKVAEDAFYLDTSLLTIEEVCEKVERFCIDSKSP